jgi:hypothetical protein
MYACEWFVGGTDHYSFPSNPSNYSCLTAVEGPRCHVCHDSMLPGSRNRRRNTGIVIRYIIPYMSHGSMVWKENEASDWIANKMLFCW